MVHLIAISLISLLTWAEDYKPEKCNRNNPPHCACDRDEGDQYSHVLGLCESTDDGPTSVLCVSNDQEHDLRARVRTVSHAEQSVTILLGEEEEEQVDVVLNGADRSADPRVFYKTEDPGIGLGFGFGRGEYSDAHHRPVLVPGWIRALGQDVDATCLVQYPRQ